MRQVDELLMRAEEIERSLMRELPNTLRAFKKRFDSKAPHALSGELKKVVGFYQRRLRSGATNVDQEQEVLKFLNAEVPDRGKTPAYWKTIRSVLNKTELFTKRHSLSPEDITFVLGWVCRLLR